MAGAEKKTGSSTAGLRLLSLLAVRTPAPACAGAWVAPEGGQEIWTNSFSSRGEEDVVETSVYWEEPLGERTSFVASPWVEASYDTPDGWRAETVVGLKQVVFRDDENVMAIQAGALWVSHPGDQCGEGGIEARRLGARSFGARAFVNLEAAGRVLENGCGGQRADITAGYRPPRMTGGPRDKCSSMPPQTVRKPSNCS